MGMGSRFSHLNANLLSWKFVFLDVTQGASRAMYFSVGIQAVLDTEHENTCHLKDFVLVLHFPGQKRFLKLFERISLYDTGFWRYLVSKMFPLIQIPPSLQKLWKFSIFLKLLCLEESKSNLCKIQIFLWSVSMAVSIPTQK